MVSGTDDNMKQTYRTFDVSHLDKAIQAVKEGFSLRATSKTYGIPYQTLRRHINGETSSTNQGRPPKLGLHENELTEAVSAMLAMGHGATRSDVKELAAIAARNGAASSPFKQGKPSDRWYRRFMKRNNLTLRQPENMSAARFKMATEEVKAEFFERLSKFFKKLEAMGLTPSEIYNVDETGLCVVTKTGKVIALKGTKAVRARTGGERGENVTAVVTVNATGTYIMPPTLIFRGKSLNFDLTKGAPPGTVFAYSKKSFIDGELFLEWFKRFIDSLPPKRPVALLLDGHTSHITLELIDLARKNDIHLLCFPPHTTNYYQPLDVGVFKALKNAFSAECTKLMRKNKRKFLNRYDISAVLNPAWVKAVNPANIQSGFRGSGVWPLNPDAVKLPGMAISFFYVQL